MLKATLSNIQRRNIILGLAALLILGYAVYANLTNSPSQSQSTVIISEEGFFPERIVIEPGTTVTWVNEGGRPHWPASNFHPTHTFYPEEGGCLGSMLDSCRGLEPGEAYSFKFDKIGVWPMHDHLFPGLVMTVEVIKGGVDEQAIKYSGKASPGEFRALDYGQQISIIKDMSKANPKEAWEYLKEAFIVRGQVVGNAHEFSHIIGNESYRRSGIKGISICDAAFAFGCFHGVTEAMLLKEGVSKIKSIEEDCLKVFPPEKSQDYTGCIHGTGHGIYTWEKGNLKQSLLDCDIISEPYRQYCYDGVFMENSSNPDGVSFDADVPWGFCTDLHERYHRNCARYQVQIFLAAYPNSVKDVGINCALGSTALLRETCFESLGYYVAQNSLGEENKIWDKCATIADAEGREICTTGAAIETIFQKYGPYEKTSPSLCGRLSQPKRDFCINRINPMLK